MLSSCNAFVLFSDCEGFSIATVEALMQGLPAIITKCGGPEEYMTEKHGITIKQRNVSGLRDAMLEMMNCYNKYDPIFIKESVIERFIPRKVGAKLHKLTKNVVNNHRYKNLRRSIWKQAILKRVHYFFKPSFKAFPNTGGQ